MRSKTKMWMWYGCATISLIAAWVVEASCLGNWSTWRYGLYCNVEPEKLSLLVGQLADADGELTDELIVEQLNAIARQAAAGFVAGDGFPVFGPLL